MSYRITSEITDADLKPYGYAPGNYMNTCTTCEKIATDVDKRATTCRKCAEQAFYVAEKKWMWAEPLESPTKVIEKLRADHDRRVTELLEANNRLVEDRRAIAAAAGVLIHRLAEAQLIPTFRAIADLDKALKEHGPR